MSFGQRLRGLRRDFDLSQAELGDKAGCSVNTIRKLESDERKPSRELAARLAGVFELPQRERADFQRLARGATLSGRPALPSPMTRLVGREVDLATLRERLLSSDVRLLTLVGPPGVGKTRLALQAAVELQSRMQDGVVFVPLASVRDAALVLDTVAEALGVRGTGARPVEQAMLDQLGQAQVLLVLDNFEQVLAAGGVLPPLLAAAPRLKLLVTSREPLGLYGEHVYSVPTLGLPMLADRRGRRAPNGSASETLFLERARALRPDFGTRAGDEPLIAEICVRLEGFPLAIELAASRARSMSPRSMLADLSQRLDLFAAGPSDFSPRQRSIRGALDWSYDLLDPAERQLLGRLTVFAAAATQAAIDDVCGGARQAVRGLADKSLLTVVEAAGQARFGMFQVVHDYALEKWSAQEDAAAREALAERCAGYFAGEADAIPLAVRGPDQQRWLEHVHAELDDLRAALTWSLAHHDGGFAGRLGAGLWPFWRRRGLYHEGRRWLDQVLALGDDVPEPHRAAVRNGAGVLALLQTDYAAAQAHLEWSRAQYAALGDSFGEAFAVSNLGWLARNREQIDLAQELFEMSLRQRRDIGDVWGEAWTLNNLGVVALDRSNLPAARALLSESVELFRRVGDQSGSLQALNNLGWVVQALGEYAQARTLFAESLSLARGAADARGVANSLGDLALMAMYTGDYAKANELFEDSLAAHSALGDQRNVASCIEGLAGVAAVAGRPIDAARLFGLAAARRESLGAPLMAMDRGRYEETLAAARDQLDDASWQRAWDEGQRSSVAELLPPLAL